MDIKSERKTGTAIPTAGEIFPDGTIIELLRDPGNADGLTLVHCHKKILDVQPTFSHAGQLYGPIRLNQDVSKAVRFPTRVATPETTRKLFADTHALLINYLGQLDACTTAMVFAVFASWMAPVLPMAPILSMFAPPGTPKNLALQLLDLLCRRPIRLAGPGRADLLRVPMSLNPTLLLDEPDLKHAMQSILQAGAHRGVYVPTSDGMRDLFGFKIICSRKPIVGTELETDALRVALIPVARELPSLDQKSGTEIAEKFQARFLRYFLQNSSRVQIPCFKGSRLSQPLQDMARAFGAAIVGDDEIQKRILPLLDVQDEEIRSDRARTCDAVVLEAGLFFIHQDGWSKVRSDSVAEKVNAIYKGRGDVQQVSAESVGWAIKRLRIPGGRINRAGNGIELNATTCRLIHELALSYGVRAMQGPLRSDCSYCRQLEAMIAQSKT